MKLEELQKAWKSLNDKVIQNEIIHPEEIMEVLANRKESNLKKIQRLEKTIWVLIALVNIVVIYLFTFSQSPIPLSIRIGAFIITLSALFMQSCVLKSIKRIATETNLEKQIQHILRYRLLYNRINIISYASIILFFRYLPPLLRHTIKLYTDRSNAIGVLYFRLLHLSFYPR